MKPDISTLLEIHRNGNVGEFVEELKSRDDALSLLCSEVSKSAIERLNAFDIDVKEVEGFVEGLGTLRFHDVDAFKAFQETAVALTGEWNVETASVAIGLWLESEQPLPLKTSANTVGVVPPVKAVRYVESVEPDASPESHAWISPDGTKLRFPHHVGQDVSIEHVVDALTMLWSGNSECRKDENGNLVDEPSVSPEDVEAVVAHLLQHLSEATGRKLEPLSDGRWYDVVGDVVDRTTAAGLMAAIESAKLTSRQRVFASAFLFRRGIERVGDTWNIDLFRTSTGSAVKRWSVGLKSESLEEELTAMRSAAIETFGLSETEIERLDARIEGIKSLAAGEESDSIPVELSPQHIDRALENLSTPSGTYAALVGVCRRNGISREEVEAASKAYSVFATPVLVKLYEGLESAEKSSNGAGSPRSVELLPNPAGISEEEDSSSDQSQNDDVLEAFVFGAAVGRRSQI